MSGRIRSIKPELLEDAVTAGISSNAFRLYVGSILLADDYGNFRAESRKLLGDIFWARPEVTVDTVNTLLVELVGAGCTPSQQGLFGLYRVRGQVYGHIRNWEKHQRVDKMGQPRCPGPNDKESSSYSPTSESSRHIRETPAPDLDLDLDQDLDPDPDQERPFGRSDRSLAPVVLLDPGKDPSSPSPPCGSEVLPLPRQPETPTRRSPEAEIFDHWVAGWKRIVHGIRTPKLDAKRRAKIKARLREGFTIDDLKRAIDGMWASEWHVERHRHDIELVCRDAGHVENFMERTAPPADDDIPDHVRADDLTPAPTPEEAKLVSEGFNALSERMIGRMVVR